MHTAMQREKLINLVLVPLHPRGGSPSKPYSQIAVCYYCLADADLLVPPRKFLLFVDLFSIATGHRAKSVYTENDTAPKTEKCTQGQ